MPVRIEDVQNSKSGKSYRVRLGDQWFGAYLTYKDQPNIMTAVGRMVEVETETKEKVGPWIMAWRFSMDQTLPAGARPITPHQGAAQKGDAVTLPSKGSSSPTTTEPARQLSAEELKVVNGIVMAIVQYRIGGTVLLNAEFSDYLENIQLAMKAIAQTVREM